MTMTDELLNTFQQLDDTQRQRLLNFARVLAKTPQIQGETGMSIVAATGFFEAQALDEMETAIEEANGIDWHGWD